MEQLKIQSQGLHTAQHIKDGPLVVVMPVANAYRHQQIITHMRCGDKAPAAHMEDAVKAQQKAAQDQAAQV